MRPGTQYVEIGLVRECKPTSFPIRKLLSSSACLQSPNCCEPQKSERELWQGQSWDRSCSFELQLPLPLCIAISWLEISRYFAVSLCPLNFCKVGQHTRLCAAYSMPYFCQFYFSLPNKLASWFLASVVREWGSRGRRWGKWPFFQQRGVFCRPMYQVANGWRWVSIPPGLRELGTLYRQILGLNHWLEMTRCFLLLWVIHQGWWTCSIIPLEIFRWDQAHRTIEIGLENTWMQAMSLSDKKIRSIIQIMFALARLLWTTEVWYEIHGQGFRAWDRHVLLSCSCHCSCPLQSPDLRFQHISTSVYVHWISLK